MLDGALNIVNNGNGSLEWTAEVVYDEPAQSHQYPDYLSVRGQLPPVESVNSSGRAPHPAPYAMDDSQTLRNPEDMAYCYVAYEASSGLTQGPASFILNNPANITRFGATASDFVAASDWANDTWYAALYGGVQFMTIDPTTGAYTVLGSTGDYVGMSYNVQDEIMYGLTYDGGLETINLLNGAHSAVGNAGTSGFIAFEIDNDGAAFAVNIVTDQFGSINLTTGAWTAIGPVGFDASYAQDMSCDPSTNELYWAAYDAAAGGKLLIVNKATGASTLVGAFPGGAEIDGFAIPGSAGASGWLTLGQYSGNMNAFTNFTLPAYFNAENTEAGEVYFAHVNFTSNPDVGTVSIPVTMTIAGPALAMPDDLAATLTNPITGQVAISWTFAPTDAFLNFIVKRDGVTLGTTTGMTFTDMLPTYGVYNYTVQAVYDEGASVPAGPVELEWPNPTIFVDPMYIYDEVWVNQQAVQTITINNTGEGTLAFSFPDWIDDGANAPHSPTAYCTASGGCDEYISNVTFNTINNSSGCGGYMDYTSISTELEMGETYAMSLSNPNAYSTDVAGVWIDWNHNESFTDAGEFYSLVSGGGGASFTGNILVPENIMSGPTRMRIRLQYGGTLTPCGTTSFGDVEDYTVEVKKAGFIISVNPTSGTIPQGGSKTVTITWDATDFAPGASYLEDLVIESNDLAHPSVTVVNEMFVYVPAQVQGTVTDITTGEPLNGVIVTANPQGSFQTYILDDGAVTTGFGYLPGDAPGGIGNKYINTDQGYLTKADAYFDFGAAMSVPLTVRIYDMTNNLLGESNPVTITNAGWYTFTLPDVPFTGNFYAVVYWPNTFVGSTRYLGFDQDGPNTNANLSFEYYGGVFTSMQTYAYYGVFTIRPTAFVQGSTDAVTYEPMNSAVKGTPSFSVIPMVVNTGRTGITETGSRDLVTFQTMTDENGEYSMYVDPGSYNISFEKTGYQTYTEMDVLTPEGVVTTVDAQLREESYPPSFVYAEVNADDTEVLVTWGDGSGPYEVVYDDGSAENFAAWALPGNMNAVKFTPAAYPATVMGARIYVGDGTFPNNNTGFIGTTFGALVKDDDGPNGFPGTTLDSITVVVNNYGWVSFNGFDVEITDGNFYIVMLQYTQSPNTAPIGVDEDTPTVYRSYSRNVIGGGDWGLSPYQDFMMRAIVYGSPSDAVDMLTHNSSTQVLSPIKQRALISQSPALATSGVEGTGYYKAANDMNDNTRSVTGYRIVRYSDFDPEGDPQTGTLTDVVDNIMANEYTDTDWAGLPGGWYAYGVSALYPDNNESEIVVSNIVGHLIDAEVTVNVSLTTGLSPAGAFISMTGLDYPFEVYTATVPESGQVIFPEVWYGHYNLLAQKVGYDDYPMSVNITGNRTINIILAETKYAPTNLYVDPLTLVATWRAPMATIISEDFEGPVFPPEGWSSYTQNTNGWYAGTVGSSSFVIPPHTTFAVANDDEANGDGCCDYLWTPELNLTDSESYEVRFQSFFNGAYGQTASVEISTDNGASWTVVQNMTAATTWQEISVDLTAYSGTSGLVHAWIGFHTNDNGAWASGWAIDDVRIMHGVNPSMGYGVFLDGTLVANTPETTYTYTNLNYGQEYLAGVAGLYSSGYSELDTYLFRSLYLIPPQNLQGESPQGTSYVHLTWEQPTGGGGAGGSLFEDFELGVLSEGWEIIQTNTNTSATPCYWTVNDYSSADFAPFGVYHAGLWWDYSHQDEWLITPEVSCGAGTQLTFETTTYEGSVNGDHYYVKISTDGGTTWTPVWDASALTGNGWNYYDYPYTIDLSAFAGESIKVAFNAVDGDGAGLWYIWFVDNINIGNATDNAFFHGNQLTHLSKGTPSGRSNDQIARNGNTQRATGNHQLNRAVSGLIGYNVYRDGDMIAYVEHPTLEYFDLNLDPGTYSYHITAVYDLTPYGFAGQTGESMIEGPISVDVRYGYDLPFIEEFTSGTFTTNQWTVDGTNWQIAGQEGNPAPSAKFNYSPAQTDYALALTSSWINGYGADSLGFVDGDIFLDFDLKLDDNNATGDEQLIAEVFNGENWVPVGTFTAEGDMDWEAQHIRITSAAKNKVFRVRFTAKGVNTLDINNWEIDNIHIYRLCAGPVNLTARIPDEINHGDQILLEWEAPETPIGIFTWLFWDSGTNPGNGVGLTSGGTFLAAARFTPEQLTQWAGTSLTKIKFFPYNASGSTFVLKVWTGANAATLVASQPVSFTSDIWNEYTLNTPVFVTGTTELWFGYEVTHAAGQYPGGCDEGPAVAGYGDMISTDGATWDPMSTFDLNYNWNIEGFVESLDGVSSVLTPLASNTLFNNSSNELALSPVHNTSVTTASVNRSADRAITGYNILRDDVYLTTTTETSYLDTDPAISHLGVTYCYKVSAVYEDCESAYEQACETVISAGNLEMNAVNVYPNPANSVLNISLTNDISQIVMYNYSGKIVYQQNIAKDKNIQLNVRNYNAGAYMIKFITNTGEFFAKKIVITK
jgi:hypothetical protein